MIKVCPHCGKEFKPFHKNQVYCSSKCKGIKKICQYCGKEFLADRNTKKYCSRECTYNSKKIKNIYTIKEDYVELIIENNKFGNKKVLIDKEDYEKIKKYNWHLQFGKMKNYTVFYASASLKGCKSMRMHRYIMNCEENLVIDHINHNGLDNRKSNLRICTPHQNNLNKIPLKEYSGIKTEVYYRYVVTHRGEYLGTYKRFEDAYKVKKTAEAQDAEKEFFYREDL